MHRWKISDGAVAAKTGAISVSWFGEILILIWILYRVKISHEKPTTKNAFDFTLTVKCIL